MSRSWMWVLALLALSSCSLFRGNLCTTERAYSEGRSAALHGKRLPDIVDEGSSCSGDYTAKNWEQDFKQGYLDTHKELCTMEQVDLAAQSRVEKENFEGIAESPFRICGTNFFEKAISRYEASFSKYLCTEKNFYNYGYDTGADLTRSYVKERSSWCSDNLSALRESYAEGRRDGLEWACSPSRMYSKGYNSKNRNQMHSWLNRLSYCPNDIEGSAVSALTSGFRHAEREREMARLREQEQKRLRLIKQQMQNAE